MLKDNFFTIKNIFKETVQQYQIEMDLNPQHPIYDGHFPGTPVVPGVCQIGMVKEVLEEILERSLYLSESKNIKFTNPIDPRQTTSLVLKLEFEEKNKNIWTKASLLAQEEVCLKFSGVFGVKSL